VFQIATLGAFMIYLLTGFNTTGASDSLLVIIKREAKLKFRLPCCFTVHERITLREVVYVTRLSGAVMAKNF
jgi:hypothetical protein